MINELKDDSCLECSSSTYTLLAVAHWLQATSAEEPQLDIDQPRNLRKKIARLQGDERERNDALRKILIERKMITIRPSGIRIAQEQTNSQPNRDSSLKTMTPIYLDMKLALLLLMLLAPLRSSDQ